MKICLPFKIFEAAKEAMAVKDVRFYLNGIHLDGGKIESTNGHIAYRAELAESDIEGHALEGQCGFVHLQEYNNKFPNVIVGRFGAKPSRAVENKTVWITIESHGDERDNGALIIGYIDANGERIAMQPASLIDGRYPDFERFIKNEKNRKPEGDCFFFNARYMSVPSKMLKREREFEGKIKITQRGDDKEICMAVIDLLRTVSPCKSERLYIMSARA
jgi:DNA polymerase III subunit beta